MKINQLLMGTGCIVIALLTSPVVYSSDDNESESSSLPSYYPTEFQRLGVLTEVRGQYNWVVDGVQVTVSNNVLVHSLVSNFSSLYSINQGMELGYRRNSAGEIAEVWQLPDGTVKGD